MRTVILCLIMAGALALPGHAQKYITKTGYIRFYSDAPLEKIEAVNRQVNAALDQTTGDFVFKVLMKSFVFEKALMQEHFNENYVESDKYPNATFVGKITNLADVNFTKDGTYNVTVAGKLTIKGLTKEVKEPGTITITGGKVAAKSKFNVNINDYNITIPSAVSKNISPTVEVTVDLMMDKLNP